MFQATQATQAMQALPMLPGLPMLPWLRQEARGKWERAARETRDRIGYED